MKTDGNRKKTVGNRKRYRLLVWLGRRTQWDMAWRLWDRHVWRHDL